MRPACRTTLGRPRIELAAVSPVAAEPEVLTAAAFGEWLESHGAQRVGNPDDPALCPLARWLRARCYPQACVLRGRFRPVPGAPWEDLPAWAARFEALARDSGEETLTARVARRLLRRAEKEVGNDAR